MSRWGGKYDERVCVLGLVGEGDGRFRAWSCHSFGVVALEAVVFLNEAWITGSTISKVVGFSSLLSSSLQLPITSFF